MLLWIAPKSILLTGKYFPDGGKIRLISYLSSESLETIAYMKFAEV